MSRTATPKEIVNQLNKYIIGQEDAKKALAVALRNRYRRMRLPNELKEEIVPKNILMIGPTGVGKTELARRLAKLVHAPFVKVEATKFTEVGYVGRDVESMVRDLVDMSVRMIKEQKMIEVQEEARKQANRRLVKLLVPEKKKKSSASNPFEMLFNQQQNQEPQEQDEDNSEIADKRRRIQHQLELGELEDKMVTIQVEEQAPSMFDALQGSGMEQMGMNMQDAFSQMLPKKKKKRRLPVNEAREILVHEEAQKLIDMDEVHQKAIEHAEQSGIIFIDEIDKVCGKDDQQAGVSEGVQRDILPIVEGGTIVTKYGTVKTDYMLFIAAGAFHMAKPSDLIPELQGRFPIRVELNKLVIQDFINILKEPSNALIKQYTALLETENIKLEFTDEAIERIAEIAYEVNQETDNIGARRLHTIMEKLLEDLSYEAPDITMEKIEITKHYVDEKLTSIVKNKDLSQFIL